MDEPLVDAGSMLRAGAAVRLRTLAHPLRLRLVEILARRRRASVRELADAAGCSTSRVSKHLRELAMAGLVRRTQEGNFADYRLACPECAQLVAAAYRLVGRDAKDAWGLCAPLVEVEASLAERGDPQAAGAIRDLDT